MHDDTAIKLFKNVYMYSGKGVVCLLYVFYKWIGVCADVCAVFVVFFAFCLLCVVHIFVVVHLNWCGAHSQFEVRRIRPEKP